MKTSIQVITREEIQASHILIVDDARLSHHVIEQLLKNSGYNQIHQLNNAKEVKSYLLNHTIDIVILDWMMPVIDGISLTRLIRGLDQKLNRNTSIIMVTGKDSSQAMSNAFDNGVDDFIPKSDVSIQLIPRLELSIRKKRHEHSLKKNQEKLKNMILHQRKLITRDPVSNLPVYAEAKEFFENMLKQHITRDLEASCILLTLDNYSTLKNDNQLRTLQQLIEDFAIKIKKLLRPQDFIARIHPDQFLIFISHEETQPVRSLERISKALDAFSIYTKEGFKTLSITVTACLINVQNCSNRKPFEKLIQFLYSKATINLSNSERLRLEWPESLAEEDSLEEQIIFHQDKI